MIKRAIQELPDDASKLNREDLINLMRRLNHGTPMAITSSLALIVLPNREGILLVALQLNRLPLPRHHGRIMRRTCLTSNFILSQLLFTCTLLV